MPYLHFLTGTSRTETLRTPSWSNHTLPRGLCELPPELISSIQMSLKVCKGQHSRKGLVMLLTFLLLTDNSSRWQWHMIWNQLFLDLGLELNVLLHLLTRIRLFGWHDSFFMPSFCQRRVSFWLARMITVIQAS